MKNTSRSGPTRQALRSRPAQLDVVTRIQLALQDEYKGEQKGYDPYDTSRARLRDVWSGKRKRA